MGVFGAPHGVKGEIRVKSYASAPGAIAAYGPLTDAARKRMFAFERLRPLKDDMLVVKLEGVATREAAEALNGVEIFARRAQLPPPNAEEFYWTDLVGLDALSREGRRLGRVAAVSNYGAGDILEIALDGWRRAAAPALHQSRRPGNRLRRAADRDRIAGGGGRRARRPHLRSARDPDIAGGAGLLVWSPCGRMTVDGPGTAINIRSKAPFPRAC